MTATNEMIDSKPMFGIKLPDASPDFLVLDDDPLCNQISRAVIRRTLSSVFVECFTSSDACLDYISMLNLNESSKKMILFVDLSMPFVSGWDFLRSYNEFPLNLKQCFNVFVLSSSVDLQDMERALRDENVVEYLVKPITVEMVNAVASQNFD